MYHYIYYSYVLKSSIPLPLPPADKDQEIDYNFQLRSSAAAALEKTPAHLNRIRSDDFLQLFKDDSGYNLHYHDSASFQVTRDLKEITCLPDRNASTKTIQHLFIDHVMPRILNQRGETVLHAGAVDADGAIAFLGKSGSGKSTLSASFCLSGFPLVTDDCLVIRKQADDFFAVPGAPSLRLWSDSRKALAVDDSQGSHTEPYRLKKRLWMKSKYRDFCSEPVQMRALFILPDPTERFEDGAIKIQLMRRQEAMMSLLRYSFRLDINDSSLNERSFRASSDLAMKFDVFELAFPRDMERLSAVQSAILDQLAGGRRQEMTN